MSGSRAADDEPARNDNEAKKRFLKYLRASLQTVYRHAHWLVVPVPTNQGLHVAQTEPNLIPMRCTSGGKLYLWTTVQFTFVDDPRRPGCRKVGTRHYSHSIYLDSDAHREVLSWQWHPIEGGPTYPHLHVHGGNLGGRSMHKYHLPTGRVFLEDVLLFLLNDELVEPVDPNARSILEANRDRLHRYGTWGTGMAS